MQAGGATRNVGIKITRLFALTLQISSGNSPMFFSTQAMQNLLV